MKKSKKTLSREDHKLWQALVKTVDPLKGRADTTAKNADLDDFDAAMKTGIPTLPPPKNARQDYTAHNKKNDAFLKKSEFKAAKFRPITPLNKREKSKISRSIIPIDGTLDLHGQTQAQAHKSLIRFLLFAQACDWKIVLIITGKGKKTYSLEEKEYSVAYGNTPGVLREKVPIWLQDAALRHVVLSVELASKSHGGSGALYVKLRKKQP